jgi:UDP-N-acetylglucosamine 4,6-dehydratase/UDP-glucose 4-epimerase
MNQALDFIIRSLKKGNGGEVFIPKLKAYSLEVLKDAILEVLKKDVKTEIISVRPGEKYHESLISNEEIRNTFEDDEDYVILQEKLLQTTNQKLKKTSLKEEYSSDNVELLDKEQIKNILIKEIPKLVKNK